MGKEYTLTIFNQTPDGKTSRELHKISAVTDSSAYAQAATLFFLSLHAHRKMSDNAKPYISKPESFRLTDEAGRDVDSILGRENADLIRKKTEGLVN